MVGSISTSHKLKTMKKLLIFLFSFPIFAFGQNPNYSEDVAAILYNKCTSCHHNGGIAPFSLMDYNDAQNWAPQIVLSVITGEMPPWPVDTTFQRYAHERILSLSEINTLIDWNNNGTPQGNPTLVPPAPTYIPGAILPNPDYTINLPHYVSNANTEDDYVCLKVATNFATDKYIKAIEVVPGNYSIVHHALVFVDTTSIGSPITTDCLGVDGKLIGGYTPGATPNIFPNGTNVKMGVRLPAGANIVVQMHYPEGSSGQIDSTKINFFFYPNGTSGVREVYTEPVLQNWNLAIAPDTIQTFTTEYPQYPGVLPFDFSILSVFPHLHLLGEEITSFAVSSTNDTIPFERIKHWDFEWQGFYNFKNILKVPAGSRLYAEAKFNNTSSNIHNPNNPPQWVYAGEATTDEMFLVYLQYLLYQPGDENLNLDSLLSVGVKDKVRFKKLSTFPNPTSDKFQIRFPLNGDLSLKILNVEGKIVKQMQVNSSDWISLKGLPKGTYLCFVETEKTIYSAKIIKQ